MHRFRQRWRAGQVEFAEHARCAPDGLARGTSHAPVGCLPRPLNLKSTGVLKFSNPALQGLGASDVVMQQACALPDPLYLQTVRLVSTTACTPASKTSCAYAAECGLVRVVQA